MESIWQKTLFEIRSTTASQQPLATSGAISMIVAVYACSLIRMSLIISSAKKSRKGKDHLFSGSLRKVEESSQRLADLADKDTEVFQAFLGAFEIKGTNANEKKVRTAIIRARRLDSIRIPLQSADEIMKIFSLIHEIIPVCARNMLCDLAIAANMLHSSVINLNLIVKENARKLPEGERSKLESTGSKLVSKSKSDSKSISIRISGLTD
jgi:formiminotetrahydrofolate cyclodeaminase